MPLDEQDMEKVFDLKCMYFLEKMEAGARANGVYAGFAGFVSRRLLKSKEGTYGWLGGA